MDGTFDVVVQRIKEANPIEDVVSDCGFKYEKEGSKYWRAPHNGGLVVNVVKQRFFWVANGWNGDVVEFLMKHKGWEFRTALEWLADRAGIERPSWGKTDEAALKAHRMKMSVYEIAQTLFAEWLWQDAEALAYVHGRGFSDDLIRNSGMGFSGRRTPEQITQMKKQLDLYGIAYDCPQAVTILGYMGDLVEWAENWNIDRASREWDRAWEEKGRLHGMMITPGIVYAHHWGGRVVYLSRRNLPGHDEIKEAGGGTRKWKSFNPQTIFVGNRQPYFNSVFRPDSEEVVIVEGPADAETFAQLGIAAVALCGVSVEDEGIASLKSALKKNKRLYLALDDDETGNKKREKVAMAFGPLVRLVDWSQLQDDDADENEKSDNEASNDE